MSINGRCEKKCDPAQCAAGSTCVQNACVPACTTDANCPAGFGCENVFTDLGATGFYCFDTVEGNGDGQSGPCTGDAQCDGRRGYTCREGSCIKPCRSHMDCGAGLCSGGVEGARFCEPGTTPFVPGGFGTACPNNDECDKEAGYSCLRLADRDPANYCTKKGCAADDECPTGYFCGETGGATSRSSACLKRDFCRPCSSDLDCLGLPDQICAADASGAKTCTQRCDPAAPRPCAWDTAATCAVTDTALGVATCSYAGGSCQGDGSACSICSKDADCGSRGLCIALPSGERACIDLSKACTTNADCPIAPADFRMECASDAAYQGSVVYQRCLPPNVVAREAGSPNQSCWNKQCAADADCTKGFYCADTVTNEIATKTCLRRSFCQSCETDDDCTGYPARTCARDSGGNKICTVLCEDNQATSCPWPGANTCAVTDTELGKATCSHVSNACVGGGKPCEVCITNQDCGGTNGYCLAMFPSGERGCLDLGTPCASDDDCPLAPSGRRMSCNLADADQGTEFYQRCLPPNVARIGALEPEYSCYRR